MIPNEINITVEIIDRFDNREIPQTPWPEVHPFPSKVPNPTRRPAII